MAAPTIVGSKTLATNWYASSLTAPAPSGLAAGDRLFAFVAALSAITAPSGWTRIDGTPTFTNGTYTERLQLFEKNSVSSGDASANFTWSISPSNSISVTYFAVRGVSAIEIGYATVNSTATYVITPQSLTATQDAELILIVGTTIAQADTYSNPQVVFPSGFTRWTGTDESLFRLSGAYKTFNAGQSNSGNIVMDPAPGPYTANGLGSITLRIAGNVPPAGYFTDGGPLGAPEVFGNLIGASGFFSDFGPLLEPALFGVMIPSGDCNDLGPLVAPSILGYARPCGQVSIAAILSSPSVLGFTDFTAHIEALGAAIYYVCDLVEESVTTRVPISSWQGTLQTDASCYLQTVVPAVADYADIITGLTANAQFVISRGVILGDMAIEQELARSTVEQVQFDRGPNRYTCTLSGYSAAITPPVDPDPSTDRTLRGVRSVSSGSSGVRIRSEIDWFLRPGYTAIADGNTFVAAYINYYATGTDSYMDVGERSV